MYLEWSLASFLGDDEPEELSEAEVFVEGMDVEFSERLGDRERGDAVSEGEAGEFVGDEEFDGLLRIGDEEPSGLSFPLARCPVDSGEVTVVVGVDEVVFAESMVLINDDE